MCGAPRSVSDKQVGRLAWHVPQSARPRARAAGKRLAVRPGGRSRIDLHRGPLYDFDHNNGLRFVYMNISGWHSLCPPDGVRLRETTVIERDTIFIDGKWVGSAGTGTLTVVNPATEEPIATVPRGDTPTTSTALPRPLPGRSSPGRGPRTRSGPLCSCVSPTSLRLRPRTWRARPCAEIGTPIALARSSHVATPISDLRIAAASIKDIVWEEPGFDGTIVRRIPAGVAGAITPWNGPMRMIATEERARPSPQAAPWSSKAPRWPR